MWNDAQVSDRWAIHERKVGGGDKTSSPISWSNTFYTKPDKKITFLRQYSSYFPYQMNWMRNTNCRSNVYYIVYTRTVYRRILKFFKLAGSSRIRMLFFKWFFLWVSQSFMSRNIRHRNCVIVLWAFFCLHVSEICNASFVKHYNTPTFFFVFIFVVVCFYFFFFRNNWFFVKSLQYICDLFVNLAAYVVSLTCQLNAFV